MPETLDYSRQLYSGEYRFRSIKTIVTGFAVGLMSFVFAYAAVTGSPLSIAFLSFRLFDVILFIITAGAAAFMLFSAVTDHRQYFTIHTEGIVIHGKLTSWSQIVQFAAYGSLGCSRIIMFFRRGKFGPPTKLLATPPTTSREYEQLLTTLRKTLSPQYPHLQLGEYFTEPS
ncbi:MAG TPA: hypothetical protein VHS31_03540 [Tepidisphaeraceae bacterium]|jgi:hypothetical protein|nr:hypothetical protein [Tepidisphaeraceae bacterium]